MSNVSRHDFLVLTAGLALLPLAGCGSTDSSEEGSSSAGDKYSSGIHHVEIEVEGKGTIAAALNADAAPITVSNFCNLAESGFYDGLTFHRIIEGFMIQGGDPLGNGSGGSGTNIKGEFSANGVQNAITHVRGTVSMARSSSGYDTASSQFFIMHQTDTSLDGQYAGFGSVTSGMEIVDDLAENTPVEDANGTVAPENQPKIVTIRVID